MKIRRLIARRLAVLLVGFIPLAPFADNLEIWDDTDYNATFRVNQGDCSAVVLGKDGLTKAKSWSNVDMGAVISLCDKNQDKCSVDIYMTDDCTGSIVGTAIMNTAEGITSVESKKVDGFFVSRKRNVRVFSISIIGGPVADVPAAPAPILREPTPIVPISSPVMEPMAQPAPAAK